MNQTQSLLDWQQIKRGQKHLKLADLRMKRLIENHGEFDLEINSRRFELLVRILISQQISTLAAKAICQRVKQASQTGRLSINGLEPLSDDVLKQAGLSGQKVQYIRNIMKACRSKELKLSSLHLESDAVVMEQLTAIKGIGEWTGQMFLIFGLGRLNVFPTKDVGIQNAIKRVYGKSTWDDQSQREQLLAKWEPYLTIATWYLWRSHDADNASPEIASATGYPV